MKPIINWVSNLKRRIEITAEAKWNLRLNSSPPLLWLINKHQNIKNRLSKCQKESIQSQGSVDLQFQLVLNHWGIEITAKSGLNKLRKRKMPRRSDSTVNYSIWGQNLGLFREHPDIYTLQRTEDSSLSTEIAWCYRMASLARSWARRQASPPSNKSLFLQQMKSTFRREDCQTLQLRASPYAILATR